METMPTCFQREFFAAIDGERRQVLSFSNLRQGKIMARSDHSTDELLSLCAIKGGKTVVCGTQSGILSVWKWGMWQDSCDRFPGHPESIQTMLALDNDTIITGSSDGLIRVVGIHPNKLIGMIGQHEEDFPVERIRYTHDLNFLASISHDSNVRLTLHF